MLAVNEKGPYSFVCATIPKDNLRLAMPTATITVDVALKARLAELASQTGQGVDDFVEAFLRRVADADIRLIEVFLCFRGGPGLLC
jgi:hypothetical protein